MYNYMTNLEMCNYTKDEICAMLLLEKSHLDFVRKKIEECVDDESQPFETLSALIEEEQKSTARINILKQAHEELTKQPDCGTSSERQSC